MRLRTPGTRFSSRRSCPTIYRPSWTPYCRCVKATHTSNGKVKKANNRKNGNKYLSWAFVEAVHRAMAHCEPAKRFYHKKKHRTNGAVATKALASKWSKAAFYILRRQEAFDMSKVF